MLKTASLFAALLSVFLFSGVTAAQKVGEEFRPFDFSDKFYEYSGVNAFALIDRRNGVDGQSVFDTTDDPKFRQIRITATLPAYTGDGVAIFFNYYAGATREIFTQTSTGANAVDAAFANPMYVFPSSTVKNTDRQAAMIRMNESYFEKNPLGVAAVYLVEFTELINTKRGRIAMMAMAERTGISLDGTPIIRTARDLEGLVNEGYVTITQAGPENSDLWPFAIAKIIQYPELGGITPDASLLYVKEPDGKPLAAEAHFVSQFECYKGSGLCS